MNMLDTRVTQPMWAEHQERTILGALLVEPKTFDQVTNLATDEFYLDSHRTMFAVFQAMYAQSQPVDLVTATSELRRRGLLDSIGGAAYVAGLSDGLPRHISVWAYVQAVKEKARLRKIESLCELAVSRVQTGEDSNDVLHLLQTSALEYQAESAQVTAAHISEGILPAWEQLKREMEFTGEVLGIPSGLAPLDDCTTGWRDGELTYIGADPGSGKTAFLLQAMYHAAKNGFPVGCISLEMRREKLIRRLAIMHSGLPAWKFRDARRMNLSDRQRAKEALFGLGDLPIEITDQSGLRPAQIASLARQMHAKGARVIFVDFIQIIAEDGKDRREAINRVSASLRDTCKQLNIPFVVASQLARGDKDVNRRPTKKDLRESGNLEQDAHNVMLLYRPKNKENEYTGEDEIILDKQREGITGRVQVEFCDKNLTFTTRGRNSGLHVA